MCKVPIINHKKGDYIMGGQASKVLSLQKGGGGLKSFSHAQRGWGTKRVKVVLTQELKVLTLNKAVGTATFPLFERLGVKSFSYFCSHPLPVTNDWFLKTFFFECLLKYSVLYYLLDLNMYILIRI